LPRPRRPESPDGRQPFKTEATYGRSARRIHPERNTKPSLVAFANGIRSVRQHRSCAG